MPTIFDASARQSVLERLDRLTPRKKPDWGSMNAVQMVRHCNIALGIFLGKEKVEPRRGPLRLAPLRYLIIHVMPWPKGLPTAPELITTAFDGDFKTEVAKLRESLDAMVARGEQGDFEEHPAFGRLSARDIGVLTHKHLDHHLRQFGLARAS